MKILKQTRVLTKAERVAFVIGYYQGKSPDMNAQELTTLTQDWGLTNKDVLDAFPVFERRFKRLQEYVELS